jgi:nicotinate (nicotinamide) nucleotide adenylyltransferase
MEFVRGRPRGDRAGILPGAFNPPTIAHLALIDAARAHVDQVICVLPREFPHKQYHGATFAQRLEMLDRIAAQHPIDVAIADRGLFIDIAREARAAFEGPVEIAFLCGSDAAERIINWDYGDPDTSTHILDDFRLLVADRGIPFRPPSDFAGRIETLATAVDVNAVSSTEVRRRMAAREPWTELVPEQIRDLVSSIYARML